tara:strand:+ start:6438 stop:8576 length:2139 start_codon:yes stop_codon:yes gene_type:complete
MGAETKVAKHPVQLTANSLAVIGASPEYNKLGGRPLKLCDDYGYRGQLFPVNPKYEEIRGRKCYPSVEAIEHDVDMAIVALPFGAVFDAVSACVRKGVKQVIVFSAGFAETGDEGREAEQRIRKLLADSPTRVMGPNTVGYGNVGDGLIANFSMGFELGPEMVKTGPVGFASQSGAFGTFIFSLAAQQGLGFKAYGATGNELDLTVTDFISAMVGDDDIKMIACYIEGLRDGRDFLEAAESARRAGKPLVAIKTGRTAGGSAAALSHTAAIAGADEVYDAAFRQTGVIRVTDEEEMLDILDVFRTYRDIDGDRICVLSMSGGAGVLLADAVEAYGLKLAKFEKKTTAALKKVVPDYGSVNNPIDLTGKFMSHPHILEDSLYAVLDDGGSDAVIMFVGLLHLQGEIISGIIARAAERARKPFIVAWTAGPQAEIEKLRAQGIVVFGSPTRAVRATAALVAHGRAKRLPPRSFPLLGGGERLVAPTSSGFFSEARAKDILRAAGVTMPKEKLCTSSAELDGAAKELSFPLVVKVCSPDLQHKTEAGGVALGIKDRAALGEAFEQVQANARKYDPKMKIDGVLVTEMVGGGFELIVGGRRDPVFGPIIMVGAGGIYAEMMSDSSIRVLPLASGEAEEMLRELRCFPMLNGARGKERLDFSAVAGCIDAIAGLLCAHPEIEELEINPLRVFAEGEGIGALDAVLRVNSSSASDAAA